MNKVNLKYGFVAIAALGLSANVSATDLTCSDVVFTPEAFEAYEFVDKVCLEMVDRGGRTYAKTSAKVVSQGNNGTTRLQYMQSDGKWGSIHTSVLPKNFEVTLAGTPVKMKDLRARQDINVYISDEFWAPLALIEEAIVEELIVEEIIEEAIVEEIIEEEMEAELPTTAGPLPWLALFGSLFLLLGGALRFSRKQ
jgi:hypothetical protein